VRYATFRHHAGVRDVLPESYFGPIFESEAPARPQSRTVRMHIGALCRKPPPRWRAMDAEGRNRQRVTAEHELIAFLAQTTSKRTKDYVVYAITNDTGRRPDAAGRAPFKTGPSTVHPRATRRSPVSWRPGTSSLIRKAPDAMGADQERLDLTANGYTGIGGTRDTQPLPGRMLPEQRRARSAALQQMRSDAIAARSSHQVRPDRTPRRRKILRGPTHPIDTRQ